MLICNADQPFFFPASCGSPRDDKCGWSSTRDGWSGHSLQLTTAEQLKKHLIFQLQGW